MSTAAIVLAHVGSDQWDADVYAVLSMASRLSALVKNRAQTLNLTYKFWQLNNILGAFLAEVRNNFEGKGKPDAGAGAITEERIDDAIRGLRQMHIKIETVYEAARRARLTNNSIVAMPLRSVHTFSDDILELAELLEAYQRRDGIESIFERSARERAKGEIHDLAEIE